MRYRDTAVQIYDMPMSPDAPRWVWNRRLAMLVSVVIALALVAFAVFIVFGLVSQQL